MRVVGGKGAVFPGATVLHNGLERVLVEKLRKRHRPCRLILMLRLGNFRHCFRRRQIPTSRWFLRIAASCGVLSVITMEAGWVTVRSGDDRREKWVAVTEAGAAKLKEAGPAWERAQERMRSLLPEGAWQDLLAARGRSAEPVTPN